MNVKSIVAFLLIFAWFPSGGYCVSLSGILNQDQTWVPELSPIQITANLTISQNARVLIEPGVQIRVDPGVTVTVLGRLDGNGSADNPIQWNSTRSSRWGCVSFEGEGMGTLSHCTFDNGSSASGQRIGVVTAYRTTGAVIVQSCTFTNWSSKATQAYYTNGMSVRNCWFGEGTNEAVYGIGSPVEIIGNTFARRFGYNDAIDVSETKNPDPNPLIKYNVFLGSEDDAIDLDVCDAYVEGNLIFRCRGGIHDPIGISGDQGSQPILVNNVIVDCETGIGFKNSADITVINNTIVNCDKGIWLHQNPAHATVLNTIIWGREEQTSIQLEPGSTIDIQYSLIQGEPVYLGTGNINTPPMFIDLDTNNYRLLPNSPAIDAGMGTGRVPNWDFDNNPRFDEPGVPNSGSGTPEFIDMGAFEFQAQSAGIYLWKDL